MTSSINREFTVPETSSRLIVKTKPGISSNISSSLASIASTSAGIKPESITPFLPEIQKSISVQSDQDLEAQQRIVICNVLIKDFGFNRVSILTYSSTENAQNAFETFKNDPNIESVEYDIQGQALDLTPSDPQYANEYAPSLLKLPQAWELTRGSSSIKVAVIDSGIDPTHEDLKENISPIGYNFISNTTDTRDEYGHGTMVAGIIGAIGNNQTGIAGASWFVTLIPIKVINRNGVGNVSDVAKGILYAVQNGAKVVNLSLGFTTRSSLLEDAIKTALNAGVIVVAASGNSGNKDNLVEYPAGYSGVIAVGSIDSTIVRSFFSSYGPHISVVAPGSNIFSTKTGNSYGPNSGTSYATPWVTGILALALSQKSLTPSDAKALIENTATDLGSKGRDNEYGAGLINAYQILKSLGINKPIFQQATPIYRYYNGGHHFYTQRWEELGNGKGGYRLEGIDFYLYPAPQDNFTYPVYRVYNPRTGDHFYTINIAEKTAALNSGWSTDEGIIGYAAAASRSNNMPVYRYWNGHDHFYTANYTELGAGKGGYGYEKIDFYGAKK